MTFLRWLIDVMAAAAARTVRPSVPRHPQWPKVRREHLARNPECAVCGRRDLLEVHHCIPVHADRSRELDPTNLITLCDDGSGGCHLRFGHLWAWSSWNDRVKLDAPIWREKVRQRPKV